MADFKLYENKRLDEGTHGRVYVCRWEGCLAAAKMFNIAAEDVTSEMFQEVEILKRLHNYYIIQFFGWAEHNGKFCLVTSYAKNGSLYRALVRHTITEERKPSIITGLIKGMLYLKNNNVLHRDLNSLNVLLDSNYVPKICNFGLARLKLAAMTHINTSSPRWMAPELFRLRPEYSFASDVYALGIVIWEILTEQIPYADIFTNDTIRYLIKEGEHEVIPDSIPKYYKSIIKSCWHFDPEQRITVEDISKIDYENVQHTDIEDIEDIEVIEDIEIAPSVVSTSEQMLTDYATILNWYLQATNNISDTKSYLASVVNVVGDGFVQWTKVTAKQGNDASATVLGEMFYHGCGVPQNYQTAFNQFATAAEDKDLDQSNTGHKQLPRKVTKKGNARAQCYLGWMHQHGRGVPKDDQTSLEWYTRAAEQDNAIAQFSLGWMYENGRGAPQSYDKAVEWYIKAAEQGYSRSQLYLGWIYENGYGVPQSYSKAAEWYEKAADLGNATAQVNLAWMYRNGRGIEQSDYKAIEWYTKAAEQGNAIAQNNLGFMYEKGLGVLQSELEAVELYKKAAAQGNGNAQKNLERMHKNSRDAL